MNIIIVHYDEIGLKGRNRGKFENKLVENIQQKINLQNLAGKAINTWGRILVEPNPEDDINLYKEILETTFGIAHFSFATQINTSMEEITKTCLKLLEQENFETFRITTHRSDKNFELNSQEINVQVGAEVVEKLNKQVKLEDPDLNCMIEIVNKNSFIYTKKYPGPGGLPTGVNGKCLVLLSGGFDSPVAAWYMQKRGLETIFIHFHSAPYTSESSIDKVKSLQKQLDKYSPNSKLILIPFGELQKQLIFQIPESLRIIFYRRFMCRIAEKNALKNKAKALITGDALGQVASQTIENISAIQQAVTIPILRPLIGFDKKEIIKKAQEIGTYDISILPHDDCCTVFMPKQPETKAKLEQILEIEKKMDVEKMIDSIEVQ